MSNSFLVYMSYLEGYLNDFLDSLRFVKAIVLCASLFEANGFKYTEMHSVQRCR